MINIKRVLKYCKEDISLIENYKQALEDTTQTWDCHHRLEIDLNVSKQYLIDNNLYYNRPVSELIFLTHTEHLCLHNKHKQSDEIRNKISESMKGKNKGKIPWNAGLKNCFSEETRKKKSESMKGKNKGRKFSEETRKKMSEAAKRRWKITKQTE